MSENKHPRISQQNTIIVVVGPTASGKSALGVKIAKKISGEIISADSRQVYKGLNIGSGKITKKEMKGIPHYCLDIASPKRQFSAADYVTKGKKAIDEIFRKGKIPIIVGGTGFYIDALLGKTVFSNIPPNPKLRKKLETKSKQELFAMLKKLDPARAKTIDKNNPRRLIRAIEVAQSKNLVTKLLSELSSLVTKFIKLKIRWIGIKRTPEELKKRIRNRLLQRLDGIIREVKTLQKKGVSWKRMYDLGLEYRYVSLYVRREMTKKEMRQKLETASWHYARRQMTWWRKNKDIHWIHSLKEAEKILRKYLK